MSADGPAPTRREVVAAGAAAPLLLLPAPLAAEAPTAALRTEHPAPRIDYVCRSCGGSNVTRDAWAEWDSGEQDWVLSAAFDYAFCHDCEEETHLVEVELTRDDAGRGRSIAASIRSEVRIEPDSN